MKSNTLTLEEINQNPQEKEFLQWNGKQYFFSCLLFSILSLGILLSSYAYLNLSGLKVQLICADVIFVFCYTGFAYSGKARNMLYGIFTALWLIVLFIKRQTVLTGCYILINYVLMQINSYFSTSFGLYEVDNQDIGSLLFVLILFLGIYLEIISLLLYPSLLFSKVFLLSAPFAFAGIFWGIVPSPFVICLLLLGYLLHLCCYHAPNAAVNIGIASLSGILLVTLFVLCHFVLGPKLEPKLYQHTDALFESVWKLQNKAVSGKLFQSGALSSLFSSGNMDNGALSNTHPSYNGTTAITATIDQEISCPLYLKGFVGGDYAYTRWRPISEENLKDDMENWKTQDPPLYELYNLPYRRIGIYNSFIQMPGQNTAVQYQPISVYSTYTTLLQAPNYRMFLQYHNINEDYAYFPYFSTIAPSYSVYADGYVKGVGKDSAICTAYAFDDVSLASLASELLPEEELDRNYEGYVKEHYLSLPASGFEQLREVVKEAKEDAYDILQTVSFVTEYLRNQSEYSLQPSALPAGKDYVDFFLYEDQRGYCTHFATAATLMFRMLGVPARYVSGYVIPDGQFSKIEDSTYIASVKDYNAHAWTEIYISKIGWIPIETTPAALTAMHTASETGSATPSSPSDNQRAAPSQPQESPGDETSLQKEQETLSDNTAANEEDTAADAPPSVNYDEALHLLKRAAIPFGCFLFVVLFLLFRRRIMIRKRFASFNSRDSNSSIRHICSSVTDMLYFAGYRLPHSITDLEYAKELHELLPVFLEEEWIAFIELSQRAFFGNVPLKRELASEAQDFYLALGKHLYRSLSFWKKVKWYLIRCYI